MYALKGGDKDQLLWNINNGPLVSSTNTLMDYSAASLDGWVHVVGVFDPGVVSAIYINGELDNFKAGSGSIIYHAHPFCIGRYWNGDKYTFNGAIDDVQIYDKALSEEDVLYLFSNPGYGLGMAPPAGTVIIIR